MSQQASVIDSRPKPYRDYPAELKASVIQALQANGGNLVTTCNLFNIPRETVRYWWENSERFNEFRQLASANLADKLENIAHSYTDSLADHDKSEISAVDKIRIVASAVDKMQLLRGQPTSITESVERNELTVILQQTLGTALELPAVIDVEPE